METQQLYLPEPYQSQVTFGVALSSYSYIPSSIHGVEGKLHIRHVAKLKGEPD